MKRGLLFPLFSSVLLAAVGCTPSQRSPDEIRQETAKATKEAKQDAKAVEQGIKEGLSARTPVNINEAPAEDIEKLPGVDPAIARRIVAGRPYRSSDELVKRHIVTSTEYDRISNKVVAE